MITNTTETTIVRTPPLGAHEYPVDWLRLVLVFMLCAQWQKYIAIPAGFDNFYRAGFTNKFAEDDSDDLEKLFIV